MRLCQPQMHLLQVPLVLEKQKMTQMIEVPLELVVLSCPAIFFFFSLRCSSYKWLLFPNLVELNHLQKGYLVYKTLTRAVVNQIKRKINLLTIHTKINQRIKNQCLQIELDFPNRKKLLGNDAKNLFAKQSALLRNLSASVLSHK